MALTSTACDGVADNWSGASLLASLYESLKIDPRTHSYVFIGFTDEEKGLVGSRFFARNMTPAQVAETSAMVNLDALSYLAYLDQLLSKPEFAQAQAP